MNYKVLEWTSQDNKHWPGTFREKDLTLLFTECQQKYSKLLQLNKEKQQLANSYQLNGHQTGNRNGSDSHKKKGYDTKLKCHFKNCGKVMNTEAAYHAHMKKHQDKKSKRGDQYQQNSLNNEEQ